MNANALVIEAMPGNFQVLSQFLEKLNITALKVRNLQEVDAILGSGQTVAVAIIDTMGFDEAIWEYCRTLKHHDIPMLIISPGSSSRILEAAYEHGAKGVFKKPVLMKELAGCIQSLLPKEEKS